MNKRVKTKVEVLDGKDVLFTGVIHPLTVGTDARRLELSQKILESDKSDSTKGQLMTCAAFASCIHDENGVLLYPDEDAPYTMFETMDVQVYNQLVAAYMEVNPASNTALTTKKKKF